MRFDGDIDWEQMKEMFRQIAGNRSIIDKRTSISAKNIKDLNVQTIRAPPSLDKMHRWLKDFESRKGFKLNEEKLYSLQINLRKFPSGNECTWNLYMEDDGSFYSTYGRLIELPKKCKYRSKCGKTCEILYRGFVEGDFDYEDIIADSRGPKNKGN